MPLQTTVITVDDIVAAIKSTKDIGPVYAILNAKRVGELREVGIPMLVSAGKLKTAQDGMVIEGGATDKVIEAIQLAAVLRLKEERGEAELNKLYEQVKDIEFLTKKAKSAIDPTDQKETLSANPRVKKRLISRRRPISKPVTQATNPAVPSASPPKPPAPPPPKTPIPRDILISELEKASNELKDMLAQIEDTLKGYMDASVEQSDIDKINKSKQDVANYAQEASDALLKLKSAKSISSDDLNKYKAKIESSMQEARKVLAATKLDYIPTMYRAAEAALSTAKTDHGAKVEAGKTISSSSYFGLGSEEDRQKRSDLKQSQEALVLAKKNFTRWEKALQAYNIEKAIITKHEKSTDSDEIKKCEAARQAIVVMERGLREPPADSMMSNIVMHRGGSLGFKAQLIEKSQLSGYLKPLSDGTHPGKPRAVVELPNSTDESMYFIVTRLESTEVVVYHKTVEKDDGSDTQVTLVQDQHSIRDHTPDWSKLSAEENAKTALQIAIMYASNHKKGSSAIFLRGQDLEQIQRIHAALLWVKHQVAHGFYDAVNDLGDGQLPQNSDLSDLVIQSRSEGPAKAGTFLGPSQKALDLDFIKQVMPGLDTKSNEFAVQKQQLQAWKNESRAVKKEDKSQSIQDPGQIHVIGSKPKGP